MPTHMFDLGPTAARFRRLCEQYPDTDVYPVEDFRVEWGPIFYRGRLDGSARILVIGQDPAQHEAICRRILVGEAGQRIQGLLAKVGITRSYIMINTFVYSVFGQGGGNAHARDAAIAAYRHKWLDALLTSSSSIEVVLTLGTLAKQAWAQYHATPSGAAKQVTAVSITHPTFPDSASASGSMPRAQAMAQMLDNWNAGLALVRAALTATDVPIATPSAYGSALQPTDLAPIPEIDLPAGTPAWMRSLSPWARRVGTTTLEKRATIQVTIPAAERPF